MRRQILLRRRQIWGKSLVDILSQENLGFVGTGRPTKAALCWLSNCSLRDSNTRWSGATRSHNSPDFVSDFVSGATRSHNSPTGACGEVYNNGR